MNKKWSWRIALSLLAGIVVLPYLLFVGQRPIWEVLLLTGLVIVAAVISTLSFGRKEIYGGPYPWWWQALCWALCGASVVWMAVGEIRESGFAEGIFSVVLFAVIGAVSWVSSLLDRYSI